MLFKSLKECYVKRYDAVAKFLLRSLCLAVI